ncbi:MAG: DUF3015 family protein [Nitrospiraceae bacterium]
MKQVTIWIIISVLMLFASGCMAFKNPTITKFTSEIFGDISGDTTSSGNMANSTRHWRTEDGMLSPEYKLIAFTVLNQTNVEQDLARGHGEYLTSLGTHLGVPSDQQSAFRAKAQGTLEMLMTADRDVRLQQLRMLARERGAEKSDSGVLALLKGSAYRRDTLHKGALWGDFATHLHEYRGFLRLCYSGTNDEGSRSLPR